ncbi:MAG: Co2+/Mg2+ efflux protein ApaG [Chitinophagales bacterium]|nr:Co2+/Mg2+ efflux protein ApaG [Chitinophagales bacterium]MDW8428616.1 Co2+/Mg2+ efflux protein ApaG [Chitinophagales bacterium]
MVTRTTEGVKITVETFYQEDYSHPLMQEYLFAYRIRIENQSDVPIRLLRRHWYIFDSNGTYREVEGEGVVGQQPIIGPKQSHQYVSGCHLRSEMGRMHGTYLMERLTDGRMFEVAIPAFQLIAPYKLN